jgi:hypothetical protein
MRTFFAMIGMVTVVYLLYRWLSAGKSSENALISDAELERVATVIISTLDMLADKSLDAAKAELERYDIAYEWEPWGKIVWQMPDVPFVTFEKDKTAVIAYSVGEIQGRLHIKKWSIVDEKKVISNTAASKIAVKLEPPVSNYERLLYAKLLEKGVEIDK